MTTTALGPSQANDRWSRIPCVSQQPPWASRSVPWRPPTIGLVLLDGSGHGAPGAGAAAQTAAMPVPVASVIRRTVPVYLDYIGTTEAIRTVTLQAQVTGYLAARGAPDGADVRQGELLYQIDPRDYQAALDQVKAQAQHDAAAHDYARVSQSRNSVLSKDGWVSKRHVRPDDEQPSPIASHTRGGCGGDTRPPS